MRRPPWLRLIDCTTLPHSRIPEACGRRVAICPVPLRMSDGAGPRTAWPMLSDPRQAKQRGQPIRRGDQQALFFLQCIAGFLGEDEVRAKAEELSREE